MAFRFGALPAWGHTHAAAATEAELACWSERVLTCPDLGAVFAEPPGPTDRDRCYTEQS